MRTLPLQLNTWPPPPPIQVAQGGVYKDHGPNMEIAI